MMEDDCLNIQLTFLSASLKQLTILSPDHCVNYLLGEQKMSFCCVPDHGQVGVFLILWLSNTGSDRVEMILMSHLTIETPPDHLYISSRADNI